MPTSGRCHSAECGWCRHITICPRTHAGLRQPLWTPATEHFWPVCETTNPQCNVCQLDILDRIIITYLVKRSTIAIKHPAACIGQPSMCVVFLHADTAPRSMTPHLIILWLIQFPSGAVLQLWCQLNGGCIANVLPSAVLPSKRSSSNLSRGCRSRRCCGHPQFNMATAGLSPNSTAASL